MSDAKHETAKAGASGGGMQPPRRYRAFGMNIASEVPLPELSTKAADGPIDVRIVLTPPSRTPTPIEEGVAFAFADDEQHLAWPEVASFRIVGTDLIEVTPHPDTPEAYLAFPLLGPVLALLLHLRGILVLHASAVEINGRSAVFVGDKMAGKSTTAAAFLRAGHRLLTDDLLAVDLSDLARPLILPAFAQLKLSDEASAAVHLPGAEALPLVYEAFEKRQHRLAGDFSLDAIRPDLLYVLDRGGSEPEAEQFAGVDALTAVMRFSYVTRFGRAALAGRRQADHMRRCAALSQTMRVARLGIPADLDRLDELVRFVEADAARLG